LLKKGVLKPGLTIAAGEVPDAPLFCLLGIVLSIRVGLCVKRFDNLSTVGNNLAHCIKMNADPTKNSNNCFMLSLI
jgi:hypothetical protein